jgi:hypothetical protein
MNIKPALKPFQVIHQIADVVGTDAQNFQGCGFALLILPWCGFVEPLHEVKSAFNSSASDSKFVFGCVCLGFLHGGPDRKGPKGF